MAESAIKYRCKCTAATFAGVSTCHSNATRWKEIVDFSINFYGLCGFTAGELSTVKEILRGLRLILNKKLENSQNKMAE